LAAAGPAPGRRAATALAVLDHPLVALLLTGSPRRFSRRSPAARDRWLRRWERSRLPPLRTIFQGLRRLVLSTYWAREEAQRTIRPRGPLHLREPELPWEGPLAGEPDDDGDPIRRLPADELAEGVADRYVEPGRWAAANRPPRGVVQGREIPADARLRADVCVVGSGAGGAVAAARLAERGLDVVILEEGGYWTPREFTEREGEMVPRLYADAGARATDDLSLMMLQGRAVGGGTTVNWMLMLRPANAVLEEWVADHGMEGFSPAELAPVFDRVEAEVHARPVPGDAHGPPNRVILDGARRLGWRARTGRINARDCVRAGTCGLGCRFGAKQSAAAVYVPRAVAAGARLFTDVRADAVQRIERGGPAPLKRVRCTVLDRATGRARGALVVEAPIVVLAAGAVGTPAILQRSGMGGGGVGRYLRVHPTTAVTGRYHRVMDGSAGIPQSALCDEFVDRNDGYGFWIECPAIQPALAAAAVPGFGDEHREVMAGFRRMANLIVLVRDGAERARSYGDVRLDRRGEARIRYRLPRADRRTLKDGIAAAARLHFAAGAREVLTLHHPMLRLRSEADLRRIPRRSVGPNRLSLFTAHVNGTCRIGTDPRTSGCSADGQRHGVPGLYIVDGSVMPTAPGVNPQETIMAIATVLAGRIADRHA
ncbi:MAG: FAD-dependent oxidoreductase, partial [Gemmatimonadota bacterium]